MTARTPTAGDLTTRRGACAACGVPVVWAITTKGNAIPINPEPTPAGNLVLEIQSTAGDELLVAHALRRNQLPGARHAGQTLRTTHFTDCPRAAHHRRSTKR